MAQSTGGIGSAGGAAFGEQFANSGFSVTVQIPTSASGNAHSLFFGAQTTNGARMGMVAMPVQLATTRGGNGNTNQP